MIMYFHIVLISLSCAIYASGSCSSDFEGDSTYPYRLYHGSTLYETVRGDVTSSERPAKCLPKSIVLIARHGSRHPGVEAKSSYWMLDNLHTILNSTGSATLSRRDLAKIHRWKNWYNASLDKNLAVTGVAEMRGLSQRFSLAFPELFLSTTVQRFISSDYQRTVESARVFKNASHDSEQSFSVELNSVLMRSWEYCGHNGKKASKNKRVGNIVRRFLEGPKIRRTVKRIAKRLGLPPDQMNSTLAETIYLAGCAREEWATGKNSPWCLALGKCDKKVFEYERDMRDYLKYIASANYRQSCKLKQFILSALRNASIQSLRNESATNTFLFTHKPTVLHLLREMRLIEDDGPFRGRDFGSKSQRKFRVSKLVPGSGNIAFILHQCAGDQMKLQVLHNERPLQLPLSAPNRDGLWDLDQALEHFGFNDPNDCNLDDICPYTA